MPDEISPNQERILALADRGYELISQGDFEEALEIAAQVEEGGYSAGFEIAALAYEGLGQDGEAIEVLERGVGVEPSSWMNWQFLGNLRSDSGDYDGANEAYAISLGCPEVWRESVNYNQAIVLGRQNLHEEKLALLNLTEDEELNGEIALAKMNALKELNRIPEAEVVYQAIFGLSDSGALPEIVVDAGVFMEELKLEQRFPKSEVRSNVLRLLAQDPTNDSALDLIRKTYDLYSENSQYFRVLVHGEAPQLEGVEGYYVPYGGVADSPETLIRFVAEIEAVFGHTNCCIEEPEILEERSSDPQGVYWLCEHEYYGDEDEETD